MAQHCENCQIFFVGAEPRRERYSVDSGQIWGEWRIRQLTNDERCDLMNTDYYYEVKTWSIERRLIKTGDDGSEGDWEIHDFAESLEIAVRHIPDNVESNEPMLVAYREQKEKLREKRKELELAENQMAHAQDVWKSRKQHVETLYHKAVEKNPLQQEKLRERYIKKYRDEINTLRDNVEQQQDVVLRLRQQVLELGKGN